MTMYMKSLHMYFEIVLIGVGAGPADRRLPDQCFYANVPPPLRARIVHGHTACKHRTCRICLTKFHETATPLVLNSS